MNEAPGIDDMLISFSDDTCGSCIHADIPTMTCRAFPSGIPKEIWLGKERHRAHVKGDHGIQYKLNPSIKF